MDDPKSVVPVDALAVTRGWRTVLVVNALVWTVMLAGLWTAMDGNAAIWAL